MIRTRHPKKFAAAHLLLAIIVVVGLLLPVTMSAMAANLDYPNQEFDSGSFDSLYGGKLDEGGPIDFQFTSQTHLYDKNQQSYDYGDMDVTFKYIIIKASTEYWVYDVSGNTVTFNSSLSSGSTDPGYAI
ncbi:MAG: hypothetical protein Q8O09_03525, partial [Bacillota bacterium]|nr:hypothetical protein [Bacillota bacterium]